LLDDVSELIRRYVAMSEEGAVAVTLFTSMCWIHNTAAKYSPILGISSPDYGSGKSTLCDTLAAMVPKPFRGANLTGAAAFRIIDSEHPTTFFDECDNVFQSKKDLVTVINQSWTRGTPVPRAIGKDGVHCYDVFCPKIISMVGMKVPGTTASRFITIKMLPRLPEETVEEDFPFVDDPAFITIRRKLARWAADNAAALGDAKPKKPPNFHNRLTANWRLLFAIADLAGGDWLKRARTAAEKIRNRARS
jgi:putative DNA primase/helicase